MDVKEILKDLKEFSDEGATEYGYEMPLSEVREVIKALERTRWIPVSERLPEPYKSVLVCFISRNYRQDENPVLSTGVWCERAYDGPAWYSYPYGIKANVTHWMTLPEPPEIE